MENKVIVPAVSFVVAVLFWVAFFVLHLMGRLMPDLSPWLEVVVCLVVGGLVIFSGARCRQLGGPRVGFVVRSGVLLVMALFTFWKVGIIAGCVLLAAVIASGSMLFLPTITDAE
jgi:hypothetical protein